MSCHKEQGKMEMDLLHQQLFTNCKSFHNGISCTDNWFKQEYILQTVMRITTEAYVG